MSSALRYHPEIDGLRSLAVLAVIWFHFNPALLPGGFLGVDVFFVISGYLITTIIIRENDQGKFSLVRFWDRRIKRIVPAATVVLLVSSVVQSGLLFKPELQQHLNQKLSALLSFANFYFWLGKGNYWGSAAEDSPYLHYWSLSVEEQYYLFYPLILLVLLKLVQKRLVSSLLFLVLGSFAIFCYGAIHHPTPTFYLLPTRAWQLGIGCLLAVGVQRMTLPTSSMGTLTGMALIGLSYLFPKDGSSIGYEAFLVVMGASLIIGSGSNRVSSLLLENRLAVSVGKISYSLYLWHWPIIVTLKKLHHYGHPASPVKLTLLGLGLLLGLSILSYHFVEKPFRKLKFGAPVAIAFAAVVGMYFILIEPKQLQHTYVSSYQTPTWHGLYYDVRPKHEVDRVFAPIIQSVNSPQRESDELAYQNGGIIRIRDSVTPKVVLLGDSHAVMWAKVVDEVTEELGLTTSLWAMVGEPFLTQVPPVEQSGKFLSKSEKWIYDSQRLKLIEQWKPQIVILAARWDFYTEQEAEGLFKFLSSHAQEVMLVESPPILGDVGNRSFYQFLSYLRSEGFRQTEARRHWKRSDPDITIPLRSKLVNLAYDYSNFSFFPTADLYLNDQGIVVGSDEQVFYFDDDHVTTEGSRVIAQRLKNAIENLMVGRRNVFPLVSEPSGEAVKTLKAVKLP